MGRTSGRTAFVEGTPGAAPGIATEQFAPALQHGLPGRFYAYLGTVTLFALGNSSDLFLVLPPENPKDCPS
jgi:hypothetical protein